MTDLIPLFRQAVIYFEDMSYLFRALAESSREACFIFSNEKFYCYAIIYYKS